MSFAHVTNPVNTSPRKRQGDLCWQWGGGGHMGSQSSLATKMHSSKLPMTFVSSPPANKTKVYILCVGNLKVDVGHRGWSGG